MTNAVEAFIEPNGTVRLLEPLAVTRPRRAVLVLLPDDAEKYAEAIALGDTPEAKAQRVAAMAEYREKGGLTTPEAIQYFLTRIGKADL